MTSQHTIKVLAALFIWCVFIPTSVAIPLSEFYPFGADAGDSLVNRTLDGSSPLIQLQSGVFPFHGYEFDQLFVNANGHITFFLAYSVYIPEVLPLSEQIPLIAPFWADSDTRPSDGGMIWYRETTNSTILMNIRTIIRRHFLGVASFNPHFAFIATWDHIGYYDRMTDKNNTFQCVMVSDNKISFVIFLYADDLIQWLWSRDHINNPAVVGVNAGDGIRFFRHPDSNTLRLFNIPSTSNIDLSGVWVIRTDREGLPKRQCSNDTNTPITLTPRTGNMLGGTGVLIAGPCFEGKNIVCTFGGKHIDTKDTVIIRDSLLLCVSPQLDVSGEVPVTVKLDNVTYHSTFFSITPERAHSVYYEPGNLILNIDQMNTITWSPESIVTSDIFPNVSTAITIDIKLFQQGISNFQTKQYEWKEIITLAQKKPNNGQYEVKIQSTQFSCTYPKRVDFQLEICPVAIKVSVGSRPENVNIPKSLGQWSGVAFLRAKDTNDTMLRQACDTWNDVDTESSRLRDLTPCPPTIRLARFDPVFREIQYISPNRNTKYHEQYMNFFHSNAHVCFNEAIPQTGTSGQECCYNISGNLVLGQPGGGSADSMSPRFDYNSHVIMDLAPYVLCCTDIGGNCMTYFAERPGGNERGYVLPVPACIYGDPHIVTLDGLKYTFNGKGEFILIETMDNTFTLQGRMVPAKDSDDLDALGTVFSAIVAIQDQTNTSVQFEIRATGIRVTVNSVGIDFDETSEVQLDNVILEDKGNDTISAAFSKGANIELKLENGIISVMLVTLPAYQKGMTRGLMGNFNGDPNDDLIPKGKTDSLPPDASIKDIHNLFGITWIISDQSMSSFNYRPGDNYNTFYDPFFVPVFEPQFNDSDLQQEAKEVCGEDRFCLFDIAATKRVDIGKSTMQGSVNFQEIINSSQPIVCDPECVNGACVENDTCSCSEGYIGDRCTIQVMSECTENVCQNNGTCTKHVLTVTCKCPPGYIGAFCQEKEPPFHVNLINGSPRVTADTVAIEFVSSKPMTSATCHLIGHEKHDCTSGRVYYTGLKSSSYIFRLVAKSQLGERHVFRRIINVIGADGMIGSGLDVSDDLSCAVNLINKGITVDGTTVIVQFVGVGVATSFQCRIDKQPFKHCRSPFKYTGLEPGRHRMQVLPQGPGCTIQKKLVEKFQVP